MTDITPISDITVLDSLFAINLNVTLWSARRKLTPEDLGGVELPPEDVASLGSKRICNPEHLRVFTMLRGRAYSLLNKTGVKFLGGWAIPEDKADSVVSELQTLKDKFEAAEDAFLTDYDKHLQDWINEHPDWASVIARSTVSADYVKARLGFGWQLFRVQPAMQGEAAANSGLPEEVSGLAGTLFNEIAHDATEIWNSVFIGRTEVTHRAMSPLRVLRDKLRGLSFVHPNAAPVADLIDMAFAVMPPKGNITGSDLLLLQGLVSMLTTPSSMLEHSQKLIEGRTSQSVLYDISLPSTPVVTVQNDEDMPIAAAMMSVPSHGKPGIKSFGLW